MSMKERVEEIKKEREEGERVLRERPITILELKQLNIQPLTKINPSAISKDFEGVKEIPFNLTWDEVITIYNSLLESGPDLTWQSPAPEGINAAILVLQRLFLG